MGFYRGMRVGFMFVLPIWLGFQLGRFLRRLF